MLEHVHEKYVGSICMIILCCSGILLLWINSWQNLRSSNFQHIQRTKVLWKFEPTSVLSVRSIAFMKLFCAGMMVSSLVTSILIKLFSLYTSISAGFVIFLSWIIGLTTLWNFYLTENAQGNAVRDKNNTWNNRSRSLKEVEDRRLPITVVTGYLGE